MKNEPDKDHVPEDVYRYPEEEYGEAHHHDEPGKESGIPGHEPNLDPGSKKPNWQAMLQKLLGAIQRNRRLSLVLGIAIIALIAFKILGPHDEADLSAKAKQPSMTGARALPNQANKTPQLPDAMTSYQLNNLRQTTQQSQTEVSQLEGQVATLRSSLNQLQMQLAQSVAALSNQVRQLSAQIEEQNARSFRKGGATVYVPVISYHIKAIIPGRAWIESSDGLSFSVAAGDHVPGYGTVLAVNENVGMLVTSSGREIHYGVNDR